MPVVEVHRMRLRRDGAEKGDEDDDGSGARENCMGSTSKTSTFEGVFHMARCFSIGGAQAG